MMQWDFCLTAAFCDSFCKFKFWRQFLKHYSRCTKGNLLAYMRGLEYCCGQWSQKVQGGLEDNGTYKQVVHELLLSFFSIPFSDWMDRRQFLFLNLCRFFSLCNSCTKTKSQNVIHERCQWHWAVCNMHLFKVVWKGKRCRGQDGQKLISTLEKVTAGWNTREEINKKRALQSWMSSQELLHTQILAYRWRIFSKKSQASPQSRAQFISGNSSCWGGEILQGNLKHTLQPI